MSLLGSWLANVFLASSAAGVTELLAPEGNLKKYVRLTCALAVICMLASPIASAIKSLPEKNHFSGTIINGGGTEYSISAGALILDQTKKELERQIYLLLLDKTGYSKLSTAISVGVSEKNGTVTADSASVTVKCIDARQYSVLMLKKATIQVVVSSALGCEAKITVLEPSYDE